MTANFATIKCFVVMPFGDDALNIVYEHFVSPVIKKLRIACERGDDVFGPNVIMDEINRQIAQAHFVLADLTGKNPNVFYEVGIAHAIGKPVILLAQSLDDVPFDLRHRRFILYDYSPRGCKQLEKTLKDHLRAIVEKTA